MLVACDIVMSLIIVVMNLFLVCWILPRAGLPHSSGSQNRPWVAGFNDAVRYLQYRTQTTECPTVCSPLQVVVNAKGKRRLVLDLRYVNHYLCQSKFKYEGLYLGFVYTTVTTFSSKRASFFYGFTACLHWDVKAKTNELESEAFQKCDEIVFMYMWKTKKHYS